MIMLSEETEAQCSWVVHCSAEAAAAALGAGTTEICSLPVLFWRLEGEDQGVCRAGPGEASLLGLQCLFLCIS